MSMKIKQLISATLTMIMIFSLFSGNVVHAANVEATATNTFQSDTPSPLADTGLDNTYRPLPVCS